MLVYRLVPRIFKNCKTTLIPFPHLPALFLAAAHRQRRPPAPWRAFPAITSPRAGTHASLCSSSPACCFELEPPGRATRAAEPRNVRAAATSLSRWRARCRSRRPLLASAQALQIPQKPIPIALLLSPRSHATERRRRTTPNAGQLDAAAKPPHRRSSARSDPLASTAVASRNSQTTSPHPILTGAPPPPFSSAADPPCSVEPPPPSPVALEVRLGPL